MKKVARLRVVSVEHTNIAANEQVGVRTTGRIKKPKAVFDPSDNYLPRAQRTTTGVTTAQSSNAITVSNMPTERKRDSDSYQDKRLSQSSGNSSCITASLPSPPPPSDACFMCHKKEMKRGIGAKNKLISCIDCEIKVHKLCLKIDFEDFDELRNNYKCENCRSCVLCSAFSEMESKKDEFVTCAKCVKSYHMRCHIPNVHKYQQLSTNWKCNKCSTPVINNGNAVETKSSHEIAGDEPTSNTDETVEKDSDVNTSTSTSIEEIKEVITKRNHQDLMNNDSNHETDCGQTIVKKLKVHEHAAAFVTEHIEVPDVKYWSVDQVTEFFAKYFPNEARVFKEHEIDGMSLLLLKRSDVIKKLPIKLGPSLRIYSLILKIQTQLNDETLAWNCGI